MRHLKFVESEKKGGLFSKAIVLFFAADKAPQVESSEGIVFTSLAWMASVAMGAFAPIGSLISERFLKAIEQPVAEGRNRLKELEKQRTEEYENLRKVLTNKNQSTNHNYDLVMVLHTLEKQRLAYRKFSLLCEAMQKDCAALSKTGITAEFELYALAFAKLTCEFFAEVRQMASNGAASSNQPRLNFAQRCQ